MGRGGLGAVAASAVALVAASGCGEPALSCEILADPQNCWARTAAALADCLPSGAVGTLAVDRGSCAFPGEVVVRFDEALPQTTAEVVELDALAFTIETAGGAAICGRVVDTLENRVELEAGADSAVAELRADRTFVLSCADARFEAPFDDLFDCAAEGAPPPTDGFEITPTSVRFAIVSAATSGDLFQCVSR